MDRRSPEERRLLEGLIREQTTALTEAKEALDKVVPELLEGKRQNHRLAIIGIVIALLVGAAVGISLWALTSSQSAQSKGDANAAVIAAVRKADYHNCLASNAFKAGDAKEWDFAIGAFRANAHDQNEIAVLNADQALINKTDGPRNCSKLFPSSKSK